MTTVLKRLLLAVVVLLVIGGGAMLYFYYLDQTRVDRRAETTAATFATYLTEGKAYEAALLLAPSYKSGETAQYYFADFQGSQHTLLSAEPLENSAYPAEQNPQLYTYAFQSEADRSKGLKFILKVILVTVAEDTWRIANFSGEFIRDV